MRSLPTQSSGFTISSKTGCDTFCDSWAASKIPVRGSTSFRKGSYPHSCFLSVGWLCACPISVLCISLISSFAKRTWQHTEMNVVRTCLRGAERQPGPSTQCTKGQVYGWAGAEVTPLIYQGWLNRVFVSLIGNFLPSGDDSFLSTRIPWDSQVQEFKEWREILGCPRLPGLVGSGSVCGRTGALPDISHTCIKLERLFRHGHGRSQG